MAPTTAGYTLMILEIAILDVIPGQEAAFQRSFAKARPIISSMPGFVNLELKNCLENLSRYLLLVNWETLEHHTQGFRNSPEYQDWKELLHHYYNPFPVVQHYAAVD